MRSAHRGVVLLAGTLALAASGSLAGQGTLAPADAFTIVPGARFGPIRQSTSRAELGTLFPPGAVRDADIPLGEGFCAPGTLIFPGTPDEAELTWQDAARTRVALVRIKTPRGRWVTSRGVRIGTLLTDLERLSGQVLTFSGFGWDWGGGLSWVESDASVHLLLEIDPEDSRKLGDSPSRAEITGDRPIRSDLPIVRGLRIRVRWMTQSWGSPAGERDCG